MRYFYYYYVGPGSEAGCNIVTSFGPFPLAEETQFLNPPSRKGTSVISFFQQIGELEYFEMKACLQQINARTASKQPLALVKSEDQ